MKEKSPYGTWESPISAELMTTKNVEFSYPRFFEQSLFWMEFRPADSARTVIVRRLPDESNQTLTPDGYNVQTRAHEYGGVCYTVGGSNLFFVNAEDQRIYCQHLDKPKEIKPLSPAQKNGPNQQAYRFADLIFDEARNRVIAVAEIHNAAADVSTQANSSEYLEPEAQLVSLNVDSGQIQTLASGSDFYAHPRISPDGNQILWIEWSHPNMPWDETQLCIAEFERDGSIKERVRIGKPQESIFQPEWSPSNEIYFVSDRSQWWNLYRYHAESMTAIYSAERECGLPLWQFGMTTWGFLDDETITLISCQGANWKIETVCISTGMIEPACDRLTPVAYSYFSSLVTDSSGQSSAFIAASETSQPGLCFIANGKTEILARSGDFKLSKQDIATPLEIKFPTSGNDESHGYFYHPTNQSYEASAEEKPPLIVLCHGGPTASTTATFNLKVQFWTSRGFAVADINYRGSTGYGRTYRDKLKSNWGVYDVDDACAAAQYLVAQELVDPGRLIIRGGSAGGYTVLSALCFKDVFTAGCSLYGIGDLGALASDTHKFESRYTDSLIAPIDQSQIYAQRSPIQHIEGFSCPTIFFQGLKDKVVPPDQAESMVEALRNKQIPVALITYPDEAHGFRDPDNVLHAFNAELTFYGKVFGFETDSTVNNLEIHNLEQN